MGRITTSDGVLTVLALNTIFYIIIHECTSSHFHLKWVEKCSKKKNLGDTSEIMCVYLIPSSNSKVNAVFCKLWFLFPLCKDGSFTSTFLDQWTKEGKITEIWRLPGNSETANSTHALCMCTVV